MSTENSSDGEAETAQGEHPAALESNFELLKGHLGKDTLAAKMVTAYAAANEGAGAQAISNVIAARLDELKASYDQPEDQQD